jgi:16S rRNA (cytidine1402-2'-O)-methyltransferase
LSGTLYLVPTTLSEGTQFDVLPSSTIDVIRHTRHYLVENERTARRFISSLKVHPSIEALSFQVLDKDTRPGDVPALLKPLMEGYDLALMSESGSPCLADPGALAVEHAHKLNIRVIPLVGPSSILLALMASGLNGQQFGFHGYLPIQDKERVEMIRALEHESAKRQQTQIFIETPYRNNTLLKSLTNTLSPTTRLCVALDLTGSNQRIIQKEVRLWKTDPEEFPKLPAVFLFLA